MTRKRATWTTVETCKMYEFQMNNYEEVRIKMFGKVFRTFSGENARINASNYWNNIKAING